VPASEKSIRTFLLDTNVFVAAVKHPRRETATLRFLLALLEREDLRLVGNAFWIEEMVRYAEEFRSETAAWLVGALLDRTRVVRVERNFVKVCAKYVTTPDPADVLHAATCLQERAILVSNDRHFDRIRDEGVIEVWSIAKAIRSFARSNPGMKPFSHTDESHEP
jgi:predicted nucleic acid-binding protein